MNLSRIRILNELRYCWREVCAGYPRQRDEEEFSALYRPYLTLELEAATFAECLAAAARITPRAEWIGPLAHVLSCRVGRAKKGSGRTLKRVISRLES